MRISFHLLKRLALVLAASALVPRVAEAQRQADSVARDRFWFAGGLGYGHTGRGSETPFNSGVAAAASVTYQPGLLLVSARASTVWNLFQGDLVDDVAILVGLGSRTRGGHFSLALGPALASGNVAAYSRSPLAFDSRLGLGVQVEAIAAPLAEVGLGLSGFANLNGRQSFGGVLLTLALGQLR